MYIESFIKTTFLFLAMLVWGGSVFSQKNRTVYGKVQDIDSKKPINSVTVTNGRTKQRAVTNEKGDFFIWAATGDSILVSSVGYKSAGILWDGKSNEPVISMKLDAIALAEVVIKEKRIENLEKEIQDFLNNPYGSKEIRQEILRNMAKIGGSSNPSQAGGPAVASISIDALYDLWSKEGKSNRKVADLKMEDARQFYIKLRYNALLIKHITNLKDEELTDFMNFCKLNDDFVLRASDYDLTYEILKCYKEFKN